MWAHSKANYTFDFVKHFYTYFCFVRYISTKGLIMSTYKEKGK